MDANPAVEQLRQQSRARRDRPDTQAGVTIVRAVQTCRACPSQWNAWDAAGQYYYLRYRHGLGEVERCDGEHAVCAGEIIGSFDDHTALGDISLEQFAACIGITLALEPAS